MLSHALAALVFVAAAAAAQATQYLTRPGQRSVALKVITNNNPSSQAPGYIFLAPYQLQLDGVSYGPHIYRQNGQLVWWGNDTVSTAANDFHVVPYNGARDDHIVYNDGAGFGHTRGTVKFFDNTYTKLDPTYGAADGLVRPDDHESNVIGERSDSFLSDSYQPAPRNLTDYAGPENGYIYSGCFQERSLTNTSVLFQWCSGEHVPLDETFIYLASQSQNYSGILSGSGTQISPWDYFHLNAVDKDTDGNYLVSARHTSTIYKIAGKNHANPGSIIWRLGGKQNMFTMNPPTFNFSMQHDCRFHPKIVTGSNTTAISLFDNGFDGQDLRSAGASSGMFVDIDEINMVATLTHQYVQPQYRSAGSQGSVQALRNGNVFIGWGQLPYVSETTRTGNLLYYAQFGTANGAFTSYRGYKFQWVGSPTTKPDVLPYTQFCNSPTRYVYASWNGATEVAYWVLSTSNSTSGPWTQQGANFPKSDYETCMAINTAFARFAQVKAYNSGDDLLRTSEPRPFFVPNDSIVNCTPKSCGFSVNYTKTNSMASSC